MAGLPRPPHLIAEGSGNHLAFARPPGRRTVGRGTCPRYGSGARSQRLNRESSRLDPLDRGRGRLDRNRSPAHAHVRRRSRGPTSFTSLKGLVVGAYQRADLTERRAEVEESGPRHHWDHRRNLAVSGHVLAHKSDWDPHTAWSVLASSGMAGYFARLRIPTRHSTQHPVPDRHEEELTR